MQSRNILRAGKGCPFKEKTWFLQWCGNNWTSLRTPSDNKILLYFWKQNKVILIFLWHDLRLCTCISNGKSTVIMYQLYGVTGNTVMVHDVLFITRDRTTYTLNNLERTQQSCNQNMWKILPLPHSLVSKKNI
jgi:hypothetical protein